MHIQIVPMIAFDLSMINRYIYCNLFPYSELFIIVDLIGPE